MAIEKMKLLSLVGSKEEEHDMLQELVLCEKVHIDLDHSENYGNHYIIHEYEAMLPVAPKVEEVNSTDIASECQGALTELEKMAEHLEMNLSVIVDDIKSYSKAQALQDLSRLKEKMQPSIEAIDEKKKELRKIQDTNDILGEIHKKIDFTTLNELKYIRYEIGLLSKDNRLHIKKNYENISALVFEIGEIEDSREDIYMVFYLKELEDETHRLLKSLNWHPIEIEEDMQGDILACKS